MASQTPNVDKGLSNEAQASKLARSFHCNTRLSPDKVAVYCDGVSISYAQLGDLVIRWSHGLVSKGLRRGDHIGVLLPNGIDFVALILVAADIGAVLVPVNTTLPPSAVERAFRVADVKHVVGKSDILTGLRSGPGCDFSFADGYWLSIDDDGGGLDKLSDLLGLVGTGLQPLLAGRDEDPLILTMTSGSTGDPKPILLTQQTKYARAQAAVELYRVTNLDRVLAATPLYHSLAERLVLIPLIIGGTSILMTRFSPSEWLRCVQEQSVSFTIAVSSQLRQISELLKVSEEGSVASLRCVVSSSAQLDTQVKEQLIAKLSCSFHECYGASEIAIASNLDGASHRDKLQSVGLPAPGVDIKILSQDGQVAAPSEAGEIVCATPMIFGGYYKRPDLTRQSMWGNFFRTGDLGKFDEDGYLYYLGRTKDIIITGGINVYPKDIESVISAHPSVLECAAFSLPDDKLGEIAAVALVPRNTECFELRKIRLLCAEQLADFQQPRRYVIVEELPKNSMGKIMRQSLCGCRGVDRQDRI